MKSVLGETAGESQFDDPRDLKISEPGDAAIADTAEVSAFDFTRLDNSRKRLEIKRREIEKLLDSKTVSRTEKQPLAEALEFLVSQEKIVKTKMLLPDYTAWERRAVRKYSEMIAVDYTDQVNNLRNAENLIANLIEDGSRLTAEFTELTTGANRELIGEICRRAATVGDIYRKLEKRLKQIEVIRALKSVEAETDEDLAVPDRGEAETLKVLAGMQTAPLENELAFERFRIQAVKELSE